MVDIEKRYRGFGGETRETSFEGFKRVFDERDAALRDLRIIHDGGDHTPCETCLYADGGEPDGPDCEGPIAVATIKEYLF
jgi:hypothetical protein